MRYFTCIEVPGWKVGLEDRDVAWSVSAISVGYSVAHDYIIPDNPRSQYFSVLAFAVAFT